MFKHSLKTCFFVLASWW